MDDSYVAGLFDGEGCVQIVKKTRKGRYITYHLHCQIGVTYFPVIDLLHKEYGGSIHMNRHDLRNPKNRIQFSWHIANQMAATFLRRIHPYAIIKREQIEIALALQEHKDQNPYIPAGRYGERPKNAEIIAYRDTLFLRIKALKKEAFPPLLDERPKKLRKQLQLSM